MTQQDQTAPRVTTQHIDALVASLAYETARVPNTTSTIATARLPSGFVVGIGHSACVSPANFDAELGRKYAIEDAEKKARDALWQFEGYLLAHQLAERPEPGASLPGYSSMQPHQQRVVDEKCQLETRLAKLVPFFDTPTFATLAEEEKQRLVHQLAAMQEYSTLLAERIAAFTMAAA